MYGRDESIQHDDKIVSLKLVLMKSLFCDADIDDNLSSSPRFQIRIILLCCSICSEEELCITGKQ